MRKLGNVTIPSYVYGIVVYLKLKVYFYQGHSVETFVRAEL